MNLTDYLERVAYSVLGLLPALDPVAEEKLAFVNDLDSIAMQDVKTYETWYSGDASELRSLYFYDTNITYRTEPYYYRNSRGMFWSQACEEGYKMSHSGYARDMVDTIVSICGTPSVTVPDNPEAQKELEDILAFNSFWSLYRKEQMPMTMVGGWGGYRINWNRDAYGDMPVVRFHRARDVRIYKRGGMVFGMAFLDWYRGKDGGRYLVSEIRVKGPVAGGTVRFDAFRSTGDDLVPCDLSEIEGLDDVSEWNGMPCMFATPCSFYADASDAGLPGRSVLAGKITLLDDLDQVLSQQANTVRRSTPVETFDLDYCERDPKTKKPRMPKTFERKYIAVRGQKNADGSSASSGPVSVTQPNLNTDMYNATADSLKKLIIGGHLSPATMGLEDTAARSGDAKRESQKVTVFTHNHLTREEAAVLEDLFEQLLVARYWLKTGEVPAGKFGVKVSYDDFSDTSFESKLDVLGRALANDAISPREFVKRLYGHTLSPEEADEEVAWLTKKHERPEPGPAEGMPGEFGDEPDDDGE